MWRSTCGKGMVILFSLNFRLIVFLISDFTFSIRKIFLLKNRTSKSSEELPKSTKRGEFLNPFNLEIDGCPCHQILKLFLKFRVRMCPEAIGSQTLILFDLSNYILTLSQTE